MIAIYIVCSILLTAAAENAALRGAPQFSEPEHVTRKNGVDFTDPSQLQQFMRSEGLQEPFISKKKNSFKKDPMEEYSLAALASNDQVFDALNDILFDILDRAFQVAYFVGPNDQFSTEPEFFAWYSAQPPAFRTRFFIPGVPGVVSSSYFLSSPGLPLGQFREATIGGVVFKEANRVQFIASFPDCAIGATTPQFSYGALLRNLKIFYPAGSTVTELIDPEGNEFILYARRVPNSPSLYGFTVRERVLEEDFETQCITLDGAPKHKNDDDSIVCKQLQLSDPFNNAYLFVQKKSDTFPMPRLLLSPFVAELGQCTELSLTQAIFNDA